MRTSIKRLSILLLLTTAGLSCIAQKNLVNKHKSTNEATTIGKLTYPYKFEFKGNPLSRMHSATDPDVVVWDNEVWMYCSQDRTVDSTRHKHHYDAMDGYHAFSTKDMIHWTDHGEIFNSFDVSWGWEKGGFLWAPSAARKNGKYYLYYPIKNREGKWRVGVAVGKTPIGPFKDSGKPLAGLSDIDPKVFIDDDGDAYIYNNVTVVAKLKPNMIEMAETPRKINYAPKNIMENDTLKSLEGTYMHKKDGKYYYSYTNWKNKNFQGYYAIGDNPYGPFEWKGAMAPRPNGAQDHHSIIEFKGQWYYFYHIATKDLPKYKESQGRIACYEKMYYNPDGTIQMIKHTRD
jgi:arabinoxylan arabinofuranohydrolase